MYVSTFFLFLSCLLLYISLMERDKYIRFTDTHLLPWNRIPIVNYIHKENPKGIFFTGDISNIGITFISDLKFIAERIDIPIYFVCGNHDFWFSSFKETYKNIRELCNKHKNLFWLSDIDVVKITNDIGVIGSEGWYDARIGNVNYLKYTADWYMIHEFKRLSPEERIVEYRKLAQASADRLSNLLDKSLNKLDTIYLLTHFPPWKEAHRDSGTFLEKFWLPYNVNITLGKALEEVMLKHNDKNLIVLCGHTHEEISIRVSKNIECNVGNGLSIMGQVIYI